MQRMTKVTQQKAVISLLIPTSTPFPIFTHMESRSSSLRLKTAADGVSSCTSSTCFTYQCFCKTSDVVTEEVFYTVTGTQGGVCCWCWGSLSTPPSLISLVIDNLLISAKLQHHARLFSSRHRLHIFVQLPGFCVCGGKTSRVALLYPFLRAFLLMGQAGDLNQVIRKIQLTWLGTLHPSCHSRLVFLQFGASFAEINLDFRLDYCTKPFRPRLF